MKTLTRNSWATALILFCFCQSLCAQQPEKVEVQFICFPIKADAHPVQLLVGPGETIEVELPSNTVSKSYQVNRPTRWVLGKSGLTPDGKPMFESYGDTPAIASKKQLVLVIRKGKEYAEGLELVALNGDQRGFAGGKYLMFNASRVDIAAVMGDKKFAIEPGRHVIVAPKPNEQKHGKKLLHTQLFFRKGDTPEPFFQTKWRFNDGVRSFVFVYHDPNNQRLRTHSIRDYMP